ncbi:MAG TPA: hypothetical protein VLR94_03180 [Acidobacteriota bacterium]|nr:hypothetical protein [Acidobacteriota bacterium]
MKIKGPGNYPGLPAPPDEVKGGEAKGSVPFSPDAGGVQSTEASRKTSSAGKTDSFETSLREIAGTARKEGAPGAATINKVVDSVLEQMLGKEFLAKPEAASLKAAMVPMLGDDEHFMNKLSSILSRLQKS